MIRNLIRNIATAIFSLWIISILIFFLSKAVPGDVVRSQLNLNFDSPYEIDYEKEYSKKAKELGVDKPAFYFALLPYNFPSDLYVTIPREDLITKRNLLFKGYPNAQVQTFYDLNRKLRPLLLSTGDKTKSLKFINTLTIGIDKSEWQNILLQIKNTYTDNEEVNQIAEELTAHIAMMEPSIPSLILPTFHWYGFNNQYHRWINGLIKGNPGISFQDGKKVSYKIGRALVWTLFLVFFTLLLSYGLGILLGVGLAGSRRKKWVNLAERILFGIYAIPVFWMATLLLVFFTTKEYGAWTKIFPSVGLTPLDVGQSWYKRIFEYGNQLILPCFVLVVHNLAFIGSLIKRNIKNYENFGFVQTAQAFGFTRRHILWRELFPHTLLPLITSISSAIPSAIGGALIIEIIFNIPGMGRLMYNSILNYDWPVTFAVVMMIALITVISFSLAEVFYRMADPRIQKSGTK